MAAYDHPDWASLVEAWRAAPPNSAERRLACFALADASEEVGDEWSAYVWRDVMATGQNTLSE